MCLAIYNESQVLKDEVFFNASISNPDGMGLLWSDGHKLHTYKELWDWRKFYETYADIRRMTPHPIAIHFRWATHGTVDVDNCHPFMVNDGLGFIHNGVFSNVAYDKELSDTRVFNRDVLQALRPDFLNDEDTVRLLHVATKGSKLVFLDKAGRGDIINQDAGLWDSGDWFSNRSYVYTAPVTKSYAVTKQAVLPGLPFAGAGKKSVNKSKANKRSLSEAELLEAQRAWEDELEDMAYAQDWEAQPPEPESDDYGLYLEWLEMQFDYDDGYDARSMSGGGGEEYTTEGHSDGYTDDRSDEPYVLQNDRLPGWAEDARGEL